MTDESIVRRLIEETELDVIPEKPFMFMRSKSKSSTPRKPASSVGRVWIGTFMIESKTSAGGSNSVTVSKYNFRSGSITPILRASGLTKVDADHLYEEAKGIVRKG